MAELHFQDRLFKEPMRLVHPDAWIGYFPFAFWVVKAVRPETFVELAERYPSFKFNHSRGLGVLGVGAEQTAALKDAQVDDLSVRSQSLHGEMAR